MAGCSNIEKAKPQPKQVRADRSFQMDVPEIMRGTIGAETALLGYESVTSQRYQPIVARGYGLVVGLNGTGSRSVPPPVRAYMIAQAAKYGIGSHKFGETNAALTPEALIDSLDTAVVVVEAIIPQGAVKGTQFDVRVIAEPHSETTSLEGGVLWTAELRPGLPTVGGAQAAPLAQAAGPVFVNPFAEPGAVGRDNIVRTAGRILNGGVVLKDMPIKLVLSNPSHSRTAILQNAINGRFPQERRQRDPTARGQSDNTIKLTVPPSYAENTEEFIELLRHTTIEQSNPELIALSIRRATLANPMVASAASWRWQAIGKRCLPVIKDLYDHPEEAPRMAALRAGAKLNDALAVPHLLTMAKTGSADACLQAINLLASMESNPRIDQALRDLLNEDDVELRLRTYEALVERSDPYMHRYAVDNKFIVDVVESTKPMVYITQVGQPRIVLFGQKLTIDRPVTMATWSNRFMLKGDGDSEPVEVYYRRPDSPQGVILKTEADLEKFVQFLGHETTIEDPTPGLDLSYSETVSVLYQLWHQKYLSADFKAEQDRILAAITRLRETPSAAERPEFTSQDDDTAKPTVEFGTTSDLGRLSRDVPPRSTGD